MTAIEIVSYDGGVSESVLWAFEAQGRRKRVRYESGGAVPR